MAKINWESLVEFNDAQPIQDAIKMIDLLTGTYIRFKNAVEGSQQSIADDLKSVAVEAEKVYKSMSNMNGSLEQNEALIMKSAKASEELVKQDQALKTVEADNTKQLALFSSQVETLKQAKDKLQKTNASESGSFDDLKKKYADATKALNAMGEATSKSVKDEQAKKVKELGKQFNDAKQAIKEATTAAQVAAGSYNELNKRVVDAKKELKSMEGGLRGNSQEFKNLQMFVKQGSDQLKEWDKAIGDNQRNVGNYEGALVALKAELKATKDELVGIAATLGTDSKEFAEAAERAGALKDQINDVNDAIKNSDASPFENLGKTFKSAGEKLLALDFEGALSSAKQFAEVSKKITMKEAVKGLKDFGGTLSTLGKAILTNPLFLLLAVIGTLTFLFIKFGDKIKPIAVIFDLMGQAVSRTIQALKDLSDWFDLTSFAVEDMATRSIAAYDEMEKRVVDFYEKQIQLAEASNASILLLELKKQEAMALSAKAQIDALDAVKKANTKTYGAMTTAIASFFGFVLDGTGKLNEEQQKQYEEAKKNFVAANTNITALEIKHFRERQAILTKDTQDRRNAALALQRMLLEIQAQTQQRIIDSEGKMFDVRMKASRDNEKTLIDIAKLESRQQIAILNDQLTEVQQRRESELRLVQEYGAQKQEIDRKYETQILQARKEGATEFVKVLQDMRKKEITSIKSGSEQEAEINSRFDEEKKRVATNIASQVVLIKTKEQQEINEATRKGIMDRFKILESELLFDQSIQKDILDYERSSYEDRVNALFAFSELTEQILDARLKAGLITQEKYNEEVKKNERDTTDQLVKLMLERNAKLQSIDTSKDNSFYDDELTALNESYNKGLISTREYYKQKKQIGLDSSKQAFEDVVYYLEQELDIYKKAGMDTSAIEEKISAARLANSQRTTDKLIEMEVAMHEKINEIQVEAFDLASTLVNADVQRNIDALDSELEKYRENTDARLKIVGDDKQAQALIEQDFANKQKAIQDQINAQKRKAAIADKALNVAQIIINTARAVTAALPAIPLSILIGALGGLQLAKVLATPIPSFAVGTDFAPGGKSLVAEEGREIGIDPSGKVKVYNKPQITDLKRGTKILTNLETEKLFKEHGNGFLFDSTMTSMNDSNAILANQHLTVDTTGVIAAITDSQNAMVEAIRSMPQDINDEEGIRRRERKKGGIVTRLDKRYRLQ